MRQLRSGIAAAISYNRPSTVSSSPFTPADVVQNMDGRQEYARI